MDLCVIPDIHADPARLARSLAVAALDDGIAFLGDFIDAGSAVVAPDDALVLRQVRSLVDAGRAVAVMGNHEMNAILFHREGPDGVPLRARTDKNLAQHRSFCGSFGTGTPAALRWTDWFLTLPLWRDLGGLRLVHACWDAASIATIAARRPDGRLQVADLTEVAARETAFAKAVNLLLTGPEIALPDGLRIPDFAGHPRGEVRVAWWRDAASTWRELAISVPDPDLLPATAPDLVPLFRADSSLVPVLFGHYKLDGSPALGSPLAACLDYPATPCVYRWDGGQRLDAAGLVAV